VFIVMVVLVPGTSQSVIPLLPYESSARSLSVTLSLWVVAIDLESNSNQSLEGENLVKWDSTVDGSANSLA
jgi:hypothetical protein